MQDYTLYSAILGLSSNWLISNVTIDNETGDIELHIQTASGSRFSCAKCGAIKLPSGVSKTRWRHKNHLNICLNITAMIPIISCEQCGEMKVRIPWRKEV